MPRLPVLRAREVVSALGRAGFSVHHQTGSHAILRDDREPRRRVTVPMHGGDLKRGTPRSIVRQPGLNVAEFVDLL